MNVISYPIEERKEEEKFIVVKAGKKEVDDKKRILYEGIIFHIPKAIPAEEPVFAVMSIKEKSDEQYILALHSHDGECCESDTILEISKNILKKWTGLNGRELESAFRTVHAGSTYNLLAKMPRTVMIKKDEVVIQTGMGKEVDAYNVCNLIFDNRHPMDG